MRLFAVLFSPPSCVIRSPSKRCSRMCENQSSVPHSHVCCFRRLYHPQAVFFSPHIFTPKNPLEFGNLPELTVHHERTNMFPQEQCFTLPESSDPSANQTFINLSRPQVRAMSSTQKTHDYLATYQVGGHRQQLGGHRFQVGGHRFQVGGPRQYLGGHRFQILRPSLVGWRSQLVGWMSELVGWRPSLLGWGHRQQVGGHRY